MLHPNVTKAIADRIFMKASELRDVSLSWKGYHIRTVEPQSHHSFTVVVEQPHDGLIEYEVAVKQISKDRS